MFEMTKISKIISISKGKKHILQENPSSNSKRYIQIEDLRNDRNLKYTNDKKGVFVTSDDVIIAWDGANAATVGYNLTGFIGSTLAVLRNNNPKEYHAQYLALFLQSKFTYLRARTTGATIPHLHRKTLENLKIPKLKIDDQIYIANLLSQVESLIAKREESIKLLDELLKSTFLDMFGDPVLNPKDLKKVSLKEFGKIITGNTPPRKQEEYYDSNYIEWIKTDNMFEEKMYATQAKEYLSKLGSTKARVITSGALLVTCIAGSIKSIGTASLIDRKVSFNQQINAIEPYKDTNPLFLYWLFKICKLYIQNQAGKGMKKIITKSTFEKIYFPKPLKPLQDKFATIAQQVEETKAHYQKNLDELKNLFGSLSQRAFRGELEL